MSNCSCSNCVNRHRPTREEMTLLHGDADREIRAAIVHGVLVIDAYDSDGAGEWERDPEYGGAIGEVGFEPLRKLLDAALPGRSFAGYGATGTATLAEVQPDAE